MIAFDTDRRTAELAPVPCGIVAGFMHFFLLSTIAWTGVEALNIYMLIVRIFDTYIEHFVIKAGLVAWGMFKGE